MAIIPAPAEEVGLSVDYCEEKSHPEAEHQEQAADSAGPDETEEFKWTIELLLNVLSLCLLIFMLSWTQLVPTSAIPFIAARFPSEANDANWIAIAATVVPAVTTSLIGNLSDIFGRRNFLLFGCAVGCVGLLVAGLARTMIMVIGGQTLCGLAIGCAMLSSPLLHEMVPKRKRPVVTAMSTFIGSASFIGGPIIEGVLINKGYGGPLDGWRVGFYIGAVLFAHKSNASRANRTAPI